MLEVVAECAGGITSEVGIRGVTWESEVVLVWLGPLVSRRTHRDFGGAALRPAYDTSHTSSRFNSTTMRGTYYYIAHLHCVDIRLLISKDSEGTGQWFH